MTNGLPSAGFSPQRTETVGALLLAGGQSRRMGRDKRALPFGGSRFVDLVARELESYPERLFSVADPQEVPPPRLCCGPRPNARLWPPGGDCSRSGGLPL